jgi:hypothetical protein
MQANVIIMNWLNVLFFFFKYLWYVKIELILLKTYFWTHFEDEI